MDILLIVLMIILSPVIIVAGYCLLFLVGSIFVFCIATIVITAETIIDKIHNIVKAIKKKIKG